VVDGAAFEPVFSAMNDAAVRYLVVGEVAVVLHGHLRTTGDLDFDDVAASELVSGGDDE
jgi:hypothetical protein